MEIPSASKSQIKLLQKLKLKKYRQSYGSFVAEGRKVVAEILADNLLVVKSLYATETWWQENLAVWKSKPNCCFLLSSDQLSSISSFRTPDNVIVVCEIPEVVLPDEVTGWLLFLDGISDPGNLGTIIRTADWFGISDVVMSPGTVDFLNSKCIQATMGSIGRIKLHHSDFTKIRAKYPLQPVLLADSRGAPPDSLKVRSAILVIGSESHGISTEIRDQPHELVGIAKHPFSKAESLNAAIATASLLTLLSNLPSIKPV
jgi:TrmH family RNA methyltransferase